MVHLYYIKKNQSCYLVTIVTITETTLGVAPVIFSGLCTSIIYVFDIFFYVYNSIPIKNYCFAHVGVIYGIFLVDLKSS